VLRCKLCNSLNIKLRKTWQSWWLLLRNTSTTSRLTQAKGKRKRSWENIYKHCTQRRTTIPPPKSIFNLISGVRRGGGGSTPGLKISGQAQVVSKILNDKRYFNTAKNFRVSASCSKSCTVKIFQYIVYSNGGDPCNLDKLFIFRANGNFQGNFFRTPSKLLSRTLMVA